MQKYCKNKCRSSFSRYTDLIKSINSAVPSALTDFSRCFSVGHNSMRGTSTTLSGRHTDSCWTLSTSTSAVSSSKSTDTTVISAMQGNLTSVINKISSKSCMLIKPWAKDSYLQNKKVYLHETVGTLQYLDF